MQAGWWDENPLLILPRMKESSVQLLASRKLPTLPQLLSECQQRPAQARAALEQALGSARAAEECMQVSQLRHSHHTINAWTIDPSTANLSRNCLHVFEMLAFRRLSRAGRVCPAGQAPCCDYSGSCLMSFWDGMVGNVRSYDD